MKIDTLNRSLVDTHPVYEALAELKDQSGIYTGQAKRYLRAKLKATIREMRRTAKHLEKELEAIDGSGGA